MCFIPQRCCCCCSVKHGTIALGVLYGGFSFIGFLLHAVILGSSNVSTCREIATSRLGFPEFEALEFCKPGAVMVAMMVELIGVVIAAMLITGVLKRSRCLMIPFMIEMVFEIVGFSLAELLTVTMALVDHKNQETDKVIFRAVFSFLAILMLTYFFLVVRACFMEMKPMETRITEDIEVGEIPIDRLRSTPDSPLMASRIANSDPPPYSKLQEEEEAAAYFSGITSEEEPPPSYMMLQNLASRPPSYSRLEEDIAATPPPSSPHLPLRSPPPYQESIE